MKKKIENLNMNFDGAFEISPEEMEQYISGFRNGLQEASKFIDDWFEENYYDYDNLYLWYIHSVTGEPPVWTEAHLRELVGDFYLIPKLDKGETE